MLPSFLNNYVNNCLLKQFRESTFDKNGGNNKEEEPVTSFDVRENSLRITGGGQIMTISSVHKAEP